VNGTYVLAPPPLGSNADAGNQQRGGQGNTKSTLLLLDITALTSIFFHRGHCDTNNHYRSRTYHAGSGSGSNANRRLAVV
jgi:hypothetical protein